MLPKTKLKNEENDNVVELYRLRRRSSMKYSHQQQYYNVEESFYLHNENSHTLINEFPEVADNIWI